MVYNDSGDSMKKRKKIIFIVTALVLIVLASLLILTYFCISFKLIGPSSLTLEVNSEYEDAGAEAKALGINLNKKIKTNNNVDTSKLGEYKISYKLFNRKTERTVKIVDTEKPIIKLKGKETVSLYQGEKYSEAGYEASDNYDGDLTDKVEIENKVDTDKVGSYEIIYKVKDSSNNEVSVKRSVEIKEKKVVKSEEPTYIKGILIVNKKYSLPSNYGGVDKTASNALSNLQTAANKLGFSLPLISGYRSYSTQNTIYNNYIKRWGQEYTDTVSARPGHSEHQTGLAFDVGQLSNSYGETKEGKWLKENCYKYGFILRYLKGKENITGYAYEPWHIRYVGVDVATEIMQKNLTLEEYLGIA